MSDHKKKKEKLKVFNVKQRLPDNDNGNTSKRQDDTDRKLVKYHNKFIEYEFSPDGKTTST